jgi:hypothetical protein
METVQVACYLTHGILLRSGGSQIRLGQGVTPLPQAFWDAWCTEHAGSPLLGQALHAVVETPVAAEAAPKPHETYFADPDVAALDALARSVEAELPE